MQIRAGSIWNTIFGQVVRVTRAIINPRWNPQIASFDTALLITTAPILIDGLLVRAVQLPTAELPSGTEALLAGWGRTDFASTAPDPVALLRVNVNIIPWDECRQIYRTIQLQVLDDMICAGVADRSRHCFVNLSNYLAKLTSKFFINIQGDSGGPLALDGVQYGIVSWSMRCGEGNFPGVYANVYLNRDWIRANMVSTIFGI